MKKTTQNAAPSPRSENQRRVLEALIVSNRDLDQLENLLNGFNIFAALGAVRQELRHSNFLAYLLNPRQNHGLGVAFLKRFLEAALVGNPEFGPLEVSLWQADAAVVFREWQSIDITIRDDESKIAVIIENKIDSSEGPNQLQRYFDIAEGEFRGWRIIAIYLTPEGDRPSDDRYIPMSYSRVYESTQHLLASAQIAHEEVRLGLSQYAEMLRRYIVPESEISQLCRRIYEQHREALDLIFEHRPDQRDVIRKATEALIKSCDELEIDSSSKSLVRFWIKNLDVSTLRQSSWTPSKRILMFEFDIYEDQLWLRLYIGPGPKELRTKLYEMAKVKKPLKPSASFSPQWNTIFTRKILDSDSYHRSKEELESELKEKWEHFLKHDLPQIIAAIKSEAWIFEAPSDKAKAASEAND